MAKTTKTTKATSKKSAARRVSRAAKIPAGTLMEAVYKALVRKGWVSFTDVFVTAQNNGRSYSRDTVTARIRDLRKPQFGGFNIAYRVSPTSGESEYRLS